MKIKMEFNVNENVKVRLTESGKKIYLKEHLSSLPEVDSEGYTQMQLWEVMNVFGPHLSLGMHEMAIETNILFEMEKI